MMSTENPDTIASSENDDSATCAAPTRLRYRIRFSKTDLLRWTSHRDLARLWERLVRRSQLKLSMTEVYEVASFYHHFDVVREGEQAPAPLTVRVCDSVSCEMAGCDDLIAALEAPPPEPA